MDQLNDTNSPTPATHQETPNFSQQQIQQMNYQINPLKLAAKLEKAAERTQSITVKVTNQNTITIKFTAAAYALFQQGILGIKPGKFFP